MREVKSFESYPCEAGKITVIVQPGKEGDPVPAVEILKEYGSGTKSFGKKGPGTYFFAGNMNEKLFISGKEPIQIKSLQDNIIMEVKPSPAGEKKPDPIEAIVNASREFSNREIMAEVKKCQDMLQFLINNSGV